jgi:hypothetical protein
MRRLGLVGGVSVLMALIVLVLVSAAGAATITVSNTNDSGPGSLREAIAEAQSGETILLPAGASHYAVTSGELRIEKSLTISGAGARRTVIDAMQGSNRVFDVTAGTVTISGVTITGVHETDANGAGLAVGGPATVTLSGVNVTGNSIKPSQNGQGGGIETVLGATLTIQSSTIAGNFAYNGGGLALRGTTVITNSTIEGNHGGGHEHNGDGGGVQNLGSLTLVNDTITGNECFNGAGCGGGIIGVATVKNTIVAENLAGNESNEKRVSDNCSGTITSTGPNLENGAECDFSAHGGLSNTEPLLGPLANNGGETETEALPADSPAVDHGTNVGCPTTDQRGVIRPVSAACDIGAVEYAPPAATTGTATSITQNSATLSGVVNSLGLGGLTWYFQWGTSTSYGNQTPETTTAALGSEGVAATLTGLSAASTIHYRLVVSDSEGTSTGADQTLTTSSSPGTSTGPPARPPLPMLTAVSQSAARWTEKKVRKSKSPVGTTFRFTLNTPANVTLKFTQSAAGRRVGKSCVAQTAKNRRKPKCTRTVTAGVLSQAALSGANKLSFQGRLSATKKLAPGNYTVILTATNATGSSTAQKLSFTIS